MSTDNKYFTVEHPNPNITAGLNKLLETVLKHNKFPLVFGDALKFSLLTAPYYTKIKFAYDEQTYPFYNEKTGKMDEQTDLISNTNITAVNPFNIKLDPTGEQYMIESKEVSLADFQKLARVNNWTNVNKVLREMYKYGEEDQNHIAKVRLDYVYAKYISDKQGRVLDTNVHFIIAGPDIVVYYGKNHLPNGQFPYIVGFPMKVLEGRYGRGYITKLRSLLSSYVESMNLLLDAFRISTLGVYELVTTNVESGKAHLFGSVVPGRLYPVTAPNTINQVYNQSLNPNATNLLFVLDRLIQNRSFQNEFFQGQPTAKGRPTASEISQKTQETASFFTDIASEIERSIVEPSLELILHTELIHLDDETHVPFFGEDDTDNPVRHLFSLSFNERMQIVKEARINVRGISGKVMKMTNFNKLMQIINVIGNMPQVAQALNPVKFVQRIFESFDESPDDLLNMDMLQKQADLVQQQMDAAQQPGAEMGGVPVGPEGRVPQEEMSPEQLQEVINNVKGTNANGNREPRQ
tara:strand:- start:478 stop:2043 length:1566 start_codon:yes stop_codon:yes gene_type:complete